MFFKLTLYLSLFVFLFGTIYRIQKWFRIKIGPEVKDISAPARLSAASKAVLAALFSRRILILLKALGLDVILQIKVLREDPLRGIMHLFIFTGFMLLLLMHALDEEIMLAVFPGYVSTLNPFFFLRNLFGVMVLIGIGIAIYRRVTIKSLRLTSNRADRLAIAILALVFLSGFLLDSAKIISAPIFDAMVEDYLGSDDPDEIAPLKAYWAKDFGVFFSDMDEPPDPDLIEQGREIHEQGCMECHSRPASAFLSFPLSKLMRPLASFFEAIDAPIWLWYVHFLACFFGLAHLPFSRFFHILSSPISLLINQSTSASSDPALRATQRAIGLDACTHCGTCSTFCSVAPIFRLVPNANILPSEKLISVAKMAAAKETLPQIIQSLAEGSHICTSCKRCTSLCPAGINLQDLWEAGRQDLSSQGYPNPQLKARRALSAKTLSATQDSIITLSPAAQSFQKYLHLSDQANTFAGCFGCQTCTNVCPVVALFDHPAQELDLTPHQIMYALGLGLKDMALEARMIWDCTTCYQCQEKCPQGVQVADILYEMRNLALGAHKGSTGIEGIKSETPAVTEYEDHKI